MQYPDNVQDTCNAVDLTPTLLRATLEQIDISIFQQTGKFTSHHHFNIACSGFVDSKWCKDDIVVSFFEESCGFRIDIQNHYEADDGCVGGRQVT